MSDDLRKDFSTKAKEALTPNEAKSDGQKAKESVTNAADKVGSAAPPNESKSLPQQAYDKVNDALN